MNYVPEPSAVYPLRTIRKRILRMRILDRAVWILIINAIQRSGYLKIFLREKFYIPRT